MWVHEINSNTSKLKKVDLLRETSSGGGFERSSVVLLAGNNQNVLIFFSKQYCLSLFTNKFKTVQKIKRL